MREQSTYYRKPVSFSQYHFLLVKTGSLWELDCGSWIYSDVALAYHLEIKNSGRNNVKLCSSPSDNEQVIQRIIKETNRFAR